MNTELSQLAQSIIYNYLHVPIGPRCVCPYFNNRRSKIRGGLRALVGKGSPEDIKEEVEIISLKEKKDLQKCTSQELKEFLVDQGIGIDCSGFAYHVLDAELRARSKDRLSTHIFFPHSFLKKIYAKLRPAENTNVTTFALEKNSTPVDVSDVRAGDMIFILGTGKEKTYNHIMVVVDVRGSSNDRVLSYAHSYAWPSEGKYGHGVRTGEIRASDLSQPLTKALWTEKGMSGKDNYTLQTALEAHTVSIRRLRALLK